MADQYSPFSGQLSPDAPNTGLDITANGHVFLTQGDSVVALTAADVQMLASQVHVRQVRD